MSVRECACVYSTKVGTRNSRLREERCNFTFSLVLFCYYLPAAVVAVLQGALFVKATNGASVRARVRFMWAFNPEHNELDDSHPQLLALNPKVPDAQQTTAAQQQQSSSSRTISANLTWAHTHRNACPPSQHPTLPSFQANHIPNLVQVCICTKYTFFCSCTSPTRPAAGRFSRSLLRGTQGGACTPRRECGPRPGSVACALGVQSRAIWQVIMGSPRRASQDNGKSTI